MSEVLYSQVRAKNESFRVDSTYFKKTYLLEQQLIRFKNVVALSDSGADLKSFGAYSLNNEVNYLDEGIPFIRGINMKAGRIVFDNMIYINEKANSLLWKSEVKPEMVLLSMSGTIGDVALASKEWKYPINSNQDIAKIDTKGRINPYYLYSFLTSKYGQNYLYREARGSVQQHVFLSQMEQFEIPLFSELFNTSIQQVIEYSENSIKQSNSAYAQAESLLLNTLGMANFTPSSEPINIKSLKDSFEQSGRLDAEYYQPKYEQIVAHLKAQPHALLSDVVDIRKSVEPGSDAYCDGDELGLPFLRVADYSQHGVDVPQKRLKFEYIANNAEVFNDLKPLKNTILFSKDGSVGEAYCLREDANFITSSAILHLTLKDTQTLLPEYLTLALNSQLVKMQSERDAGGSIILH